MIEATGMSTQSRILKMEFDDKELRKVDALKELYGIKQNTELVRFIITKEYNDKVKPNI